MDANLIVASGITVAENHTERFEFELSLFGSSLHLCPHPPRPPPSSPILSSIYL